MQYLSGFIPILIGIPRSPVPNAFGTRMSENTVSAVFMRGYKNMLSPGDILNYTDHSVIHLRIEQYLRMVQTEQIVLMTPGKL